MTSQRHDLVDFQKVKLSFRDWLIAVVFLSGNTIAVISYINSRFGQLEVNDAVQTGQISDLRTQRDQTNSKLDQINSTLSGLAIRVAEMAGTRSRQ